MTIDTEKQAKEMGMAVLKCIMGLADINADVEHFRATYRRNAATSEPVVTIELNMSIPVNSLSGGGDEQA